MIYTMGPEKGEYARLSLLEFGVISGDMQED